MRSGPSLEPGALVLHLAGSVGLEVFDALRKLRADVRIGALHPLQSFPSATMGVERVPGAWAAIAGDAQTEELALALGMRPFALPDGERPLYHAAAVVASNHLVALLGQVERLAGSAGVPFEAFAPLVRASVANAFGVGPARVLDGSRQPRRPRDRRRAPAHPRSRRARTRTALAREVARLTGRRDTALDRLLGDVRNASGDPGPDI